MAGSAATREKRILKAKDREALRTIIETENLIHKVQRFALSALVRQDDDTLSVPDDVRMTGDQIAATFRLLSKVLPDLSAVEITPDAEAFVVADEPYTAEEWADKFVGGTVQ